MTRPEIHPTVALGDNIAMLGGLRLAAGVEVGANVTFYPDVSVGEGTRILPGAVIGRPPISAGTGNRPLELGDARIVIGANCVIGANAVLYCGLHIGDRVLVGDLASIREGCRLETESVLGRGVMMMYESRLGARSRVIDGAIITGNMRIEEDVFIGPGVSTVNDNQVYLKRFGLLPFSARGPLLRRFALDRHGRYPGCRYRGGHGRNRRAGRHGHQGCARLDDCGWRPGSRDWQSRCRYPRQDPAPLWPGR